MCCESPAISLKGVEGDPEENTDGQGFRRKGLIVSKVPELPLVVDARRQMIGDVKVDAEPGGVNNGVVRSIGSAGWMGICGILKVIVNCPLADQEVGVGMEVLNLSLESSSPSPGIFVYSSSARGNLYAKLDGRVHKPVRVVDVVNPKGRAMVREWSVVRPDLGVASKDGNLPLAGGRRGSLCFEILWREEEEQRRK